MEQASGNKTDASLISIPKESKPADESSVITETASAETSAPVTEISETKAPDPGGKDGIEVKEITGTTYKGTILIVSDPKRIILGVLDAYGEDKTGLSLREMIDKYGAIAGINAGGFIDPNGQGTGGIPSGIVIKNGKILWGSAAEKYSVIGFDADGILHAGTMTGQEALDAGVTEGVSFGPALIINGIPCNKNSGLGGGFNPRTAIGQRSDGAVLLVVIEGRNLGSLGATYDDLVEVMLANGAVNASNLDGGSSSLMLYEGSTLTKSAYVYGERVLATAFLVKQVTD
jgi:exopolysaccharide biosynthesis protein